MLELLLQTVCELYYLMLGVSGSSFPRRLTAAEESALLARLADGDAPARAALIEHNLRLVAHICGKYTAAGTQSRCDPDDMLSLGTIGLIKAVDTFRPERGSRFSSYASRCIENECLMFLRANRRSALDVSISEPIEVDKHGNELTLLDVIASDDSVSDGVDRKYDLARLSRVLGSLPDTREMQILRMRYGLDGAAPRTQKDIAAELGISRSYISRLETRAVAVLRERFEQAED